MYNSSHFTAIMFEGILVFMSLYFLIQHRILRKKEHLIYSIYLSMVALYNLVALPEVYFGVNTLDSGAMANYEILKRPMQFAASAWYTLFVIYYLALKTFYKSLYNFFFGLIYMYLGVALVTLFLNIKGIDYNGSYFLFSLLLFPLQLYMIITLFRSKVPYSRYVIWGSLVTIIASSVTLLYYIYIINHVPPIPNGNALSYIPIQIGITIDIFLFSVALQRKIRDNEKELMLAAIDRKQDIITERERIVSDLHDDVGGGLSSIRMLSDLLVQKGIQEKQEQFATYAQKISLTVKEIAQSMHTIIWSLNAENDSLPTFAEYAGPFGIGFFSNSNIQFSWVNNQSKDAPLEITGAIRKNLFLIVKEALHNILKHSAASHASLTLSFSNKLLTLCIADDGVGLLAVAKTDSGNGIKNINKRVHEIGGSITFTELHPGTKITINVPLS